MSKTISMKERAQRAIANHQAARATGTSGPETMATVHQLPVTIDRPPVLPESFWTARPIFGRIHQAAQSRMIASDGVMGAVLARAATMLSPRIVLPPKPGRLQPINIFAGLVTGTGGGKGSSLDCARDLLPFTSDLVRDIPAGSGEGLNKKFFQKRLEVDEKTGKVVGGDLERHYEALFVRVDEGALFKSLMGRQGQTTTETLLSAWSGERLGGSYADETRDVQVDALSYRFCMAITIQPEVAGFLLKESSSIGLPQRFLWMSIQPHDLPEVDEEPPFPGTLDWIPPTAYTNTQINGEDRHVVLVHPDVSREIRVEHRDRQLGNIVTDALDSHATQSRLRVAVVLAALDNRLNVTQEDWALAQVIMTTSQEARRWVERKVEVTEAAERLAKNVQHAERAVFVDEVVGDARTKRLAKRLHKYTRDAVLARTAEGQPERAAWRDLVNKFKSSERDAIGPALELALESDWIRRDGDFFVLGESKPQ